MIKITKEQFTQFCISINLGEHTKLNQRVGQYFMNYFAPGESNPDLFYRSTVEFWEKFFLYVEIV